MSRRVRLWYRFINAAFLVGMMFALTNIVAFAADSTIPSNAEKVNGIDTNVIMWAGLVSFAMPLLTSFVTQSGLSSTLNGLIALASSLVGGFVTAWFAGDFDSAKDISTSMLIVFTGSIFFYNLWWKKTGITTKVEKKTSLKK